MIDMLADIKGYKLYSEEDYILIHKDTSETHFFEEKSDIHLFLLEAPQYEDY